MDLDTRARSAAQGIRRAVEVMEMSTDTQQPRKVERFDQYQERKNRNRKVGALAVAAAVVAVLALVAVNVIRPRHALPAAHPTTTIPSNAAFMVDVDTGAITPLPASIATQGDEFAVSPLRTKIAYRSADQRIHLVNFDGTNDRIITPAGDDALGLQWSSDGSKLVYQRHLSGTQLLGNLYVYDVLTGTTRRITNFGTRQAGWYFTFPSFTPDGGVLYQLPRGNPKHLTWDLWSVPVGGGKPSLVRRDAGWGASAQSDSYRLAFFSPVNPRTFTGSTLWLASQSDAPPRAIVRGRGLSWPRWSLDGVHIAYTQGNRVLMVSVDNGSITQLAQSGGSVNWVDDHTVVVAPNN